MPTITLDDMFDMLDRKPYVYDEAFKAAKGRGDARKGNARKLCNAWNLDLFALADKNQAVIQGWHNRGDGVAVYRNQAFDAANFGRRQFMPFPRGTEPPTRMPDTGTSINWAYQLEAVCPPKEQP